MTAMARADLLERKIQKHMKEHADEMKYFKNELHNLKTKPKAQRDQRPLNDITTTTPAAAKRLTHNLKNDHKLSTKPLKKILTHDKDSALNNNLVGDKMTNKKMVKNSLYNKVQTFFSPPHPSQCIASWFLFLNFSFTIHRICNIIHATTNTILQ